MSQSVIYRQLYILIPAFFLFLSPQKTHSQGQKLQLQVNCIAFYNQENLYDTINDPRVNDEEFLPNGAMRWTKIKYESKLEHMSRAISLIGKDVCPQGIALIGVSEVENRTVLEDLIKQPALAGRNLKIVHYDGPDRRGVDVALLYNPRLFTVISSHSYRLVTQDSSFHTRDQLLVSGLLMNEKIHVIVNHWPSRMGGEEFSRPKRNAAAALTRQIADSLLNDDPKAKIVVMGDLNDDPSNESCAKVMSAKKDINDVKPTDFYNPLWNTLDKGIGSLAYNDQWNLFDQIMVSEPLAHATSETVKLWKAEVFNKPFLTQQDGKYKGTPLRTHAGGVWLNGYSDHYPTLIYVVKQIK